MKFKLHFILSFTFLIFILFNACQNNIFQKENMKINSNQQNVTNNPKTYEGMLYFESQKQYDQLLDSLNKLTENEKILWNNKMKIKSLDIKYNDAYNVINKAKDEQTLINFTKNSELFKMEDFLGDKRIVDKYDNCSYRTICNEKYEYRVGDSVYKILPNYKLSTYYLDYLVLQNYNENNIKSKLMNPQIHIVAISNSNDKNIYNSEPKDCAFQYTYYNDGYIAKAYYINCDHNRVFWCELAQYTETYNLHLWDEPSWDDLHLNLTLTIWGEKKLLGIWIKYQSVLESYATFSKDGILNIVNLYKASNEYKLTQTVCYKIRYHDLLHNKDNIEQFDSYRIRGKNDDVPNNLILNYN